MLISVTAPKKGLGQTITAINLAAIINKMMGEKVILIDINKYCRDVEYYLSNTQVTKGLDDFISLFSSNLLNKDAFHTCVKKVHGIDIMSSNGCLDINNIEIEALLEYTKSSYQTTIVDTISGNNYVSKPFLDHSDVIVVVLNQLRHVVEMITQNGIYKDYKDKLVFVVNRHIDKLEGKKIGYSLSYIAEDLKNAGYANTLMPLVYDIDLINECNDHSVLNFLLNSNSDKQIYNNQLSEIAYHIISNCRKRDINSNSVIQKVYKMNRFLNLKSAKGGIPFVIR